MSSKNTKLSATVVSGHTFTVDTRYELKDSKILGRGSYGVVTTAIDKLQHGKIAIKRRAQDCTINTLGEVSVNSIEGSWKFRLKGAHLSVLQQDTVLLEIQDDNPLTVPGQINFNIRSTQISLDNVEVWAL